MSTIAFLLAVTLITISMVVGHLWFWTWYYRRDRHPDERHFVRTADGWTVAVARLRPTASGPATGEPVICWPGVACNGRLFDFQDDLSLGRYLTDRGFDVWMVDPRGTGHSEHPHWFGKGWGYGFQAYAHQDAPAVIRHVIKQTGHDRLLWVGHSMGGLIGYQAAIADATEDHIAGVVALGSPADFAEHHEALGGLHSFILDYFLRGWPVVRLGRLVTALAPIAGWLRVYPEHIFFNARNTRGRTLRHFMVEVVEDVPRQLLDEFADNIVRATGFDGRPAALSHEALARCTAPVLAVAGSMDRVAPPQSVRAAVDLVGCTDATEWIVGQDETIGFGHLDMLIGDAAPTLIYPRVADWLLARRVTRSTSASDAPAADAASSAADAG